MDGIQVKIEYDQLGLPTVHVGDTKFTTYRRFHDIKTILRLTNLHHSVRRDMEPYVAANPQPVRDFYQTDGDILCDGDETVESKKKQASYEAQYAKAYNAAVFKYTRTPQKKFVSLVNGKMYEAFLKSIPPEIYKGFCFNASRKPSERKINIVRGHISLITQMMRDNQMNLIPIMLLFGGSIGATRDLLGKGIWKQLCANTLSRNKLIANYVTENTRDHERQNQAFVRNLFNDVISIPSSLLKHSSCDTLTLLHIKHNYKGLWNKKADLRRISDLFVDTRRMYVRAYPNYVVDQMAKWSPRRVAEEHENCTRNAFKATYSNSRFWWADQFPIGEFCYEGYTVKPLLTAMEIGIEGQSMGHCVGSYADLSARGEYVVFSVTKDNIRHSTIGMHMRTECVQRYKAQKLSPLILDQCAPIEAKFEAYRHIEKLGLTFNQHYMRYNRQLESSDKATHIPSIIIDLIIG